MATEQKFTPGPWDDEDDGYVCATDHDARAIICAKCDDGDLAQDWPANSLLIAAAPDLYAALEALYDAMPDCGEGPLGEAAVLARRAMAKARGEVS